MQLSVTSCATWSFMPGKSQLCAGSCVLICLATNVAALQILLFKYLRAKLFPFHLSCSLQPSLPSSYSVNSESSTHIQVLRVLPVFLLHAVSKGAFLNLYLNLENCFWLSSWSPVTSRSFICYLQHWALNQDSPHLIAWPFKQPS